MHKSLSTKKHLRQRPMYISKTEILLKPTPSIHNWFLSMEAIPCTRLDLGLLEYMLPPIATSVSSS